MSALLEVAGDLAIVADGDRIRVAFRGDVVALELPDLRTARALRRRLPRRVRRAWLRRVQATLARAGLELQVWIGRRQVARLATGTRPNQVSAWLGLDPLELEVRPLLKLLARFHRGAPGRDDDAGDGDGDKELGSSGGRGEAHR